MSADPSAPELREIHGPSALGGGTRRFWDLLLLISVTEFKKTYFGTALGYLWSLLKPLLLFGVLLFVFTKIFRLGSQVPHYPVLLLFNVVLFGLFQEATSQAVGSVVGQEGIVRKTQFPRLVIPLSICVTSVFNLAVNLIIVVIFLLAFHVYPTWTWLLFPAIVAVLFVLAVAVSLLLSSLYVRFRDVAIIWGVFVTALFYATPVLYPFQDPPVPSAYREVMAINPLVPLFAEARKLVIDPSAPGAAAAVGGWSHLIPAALITVGLCVGSIWYFNRESPRVAEQL
jgi:ABC-2 type transport system permease protein